MENSKLTVVMYHYVRDLKNSRYPNIKGLDRKLFIEQVEYLQRNYTPITMEQAIETTKNNIPLPTKSVLLTFDDGYSDHFNTVFPILKNRGIQGSFFAPVKALTENSVLDVNKIHFILASGKDINILIEIIKSLLIKYRKQYNLDTFDKYYTKLAIASRFDTADVMFVKSLLQAELPVEVRNLIVDELFTEIVGIPQDIFSRELYMNEEQLQCMARSGMHIGSHGFDHFWLETLDKESQCNEIKKSVAFIKNIYGDQFKQWTMCYPYGSYNDDTISILKSNGCMAGFTTEVRVADLAKDNILTLPRLDTNDIPKKNNAVVNEWFSKG